MSVLRRPRWVAVVVLILGLCLAALGTLAQARKNRQEAGERFDALAQRVAAQIASRMRIYEYGLRGARGALMVAEPLDRQRFRTYASTRDRKEFPGARGFGVIRRVATQDEAAFVAAERGDGAPAFAVRQLSPHEGDRYVVQFIEPIDRNVAALGLDMASEPRRREAAETAIRSGVATITPPITLVEDPNDHGGAFLLMLPAYKLGAPVATPAERQAAAIGWTYASLVATELFSEVERLEGAAGLYAVALRDASTPEEPSFYDSARGDGLAAGTTRTLLIPVYGRTWQAEVRALPAFAASLDQREPARVALGAAALAALIAALVGMFVASAERERLSRRVQARRAAIVEGSSDAIIGETLDGVVTYWNGAAERLFGYYAAFAVGRKVASLLLPAGREIEDAAIRGAIARGAWVPPFDTTRKRMDGVMLDVSVTASPIYGPGGTCVGFSKTLRDVSEARRAQKELADLNASLEAQVAERTASLDVALHDLQSILDALPSLVGYWDENLNNRVANGAYRRVYGRTPEAMRGESMRLLVGDELFERVRPRAEAALRGEPQEFEISLPNPTGPGVQHRLVHFVPDVVDGKVRGFYSLGHPVTELVESRQELAQAQRDNGALLDTLHQYAIVSVADSGGCLLDVSDSFCAITGYTREELIGNNHRVSNSGAHSAAFWAAMWEQISAGHSWRGEVCNRTKDGSLYWVDCMIAPFVRDDGSVEKYVSIRTDITERKRAESRLRATSDLLEGVLAAASEIAIIATDVEGTITIFNRGAQRMLGYSESEMVGVTSPARLHVAEEIERRGLELSAEYGEPITGFRVFVQKALGQGPETREWTYVRKDGRQLPVSLTATAMRDREGKLFGFLGMALDISAQKDKDDSLGLAVQKAKLASRAKSRFLATMSHEIRTPLNAVIGLSYLLERTPLDTEQSSHLAKIQLAGKALLAIINDVLDLSKIEAGELRIERAPFHLGTILGDLSDLYSQQAEGKGVAFVVDAPQDLPQAVIGDATRLQQLLTNLLTNAIKFTERGEVRLRVRSLPGDDGGVRLRFIVVDTGVGIAPEALPQLFSPFVQADASTTRRFGGTGLGLSIVKQLAELMGGRWG